MGSRTTAQRAAQADRLTWIPALDGLRGFAVLAVMLSHYPTKRWFPGGFLGVDVFFVLSGFLITTLLLQEWHSAGRISLRRFYARRAFRLLPALAVLLVVFGSICLIFQDAAFTGHQETGRVLTSILAACLYVFNLIRVFGGRPAADINPLWSLSIEEQYYLLWPAVLIVLLNLKVKPWQAIGGCFLVAATCASLPLILRGLPYWTFYFGTHFRAAELLTGSILGQMFVAGWLRPSLTRSVGFRLALASSIGFLTYWLLFLTDRDAFLFDGWHAGAALASAVVVIACVYARPGPLTSVVTNRLIVYIGRRSYALYLWHLPINYWLRDLDAVPQTLIACALAFFAAELSYRFVESPMLSLKRRLGQPQTAAAPAAEALATPA